MRGLVAGFLPYHKRGAFLTPSSEFQMNPSKVVGLSDSIVFSMWLRRSCGSDVSYRHTIFNNMSKTSYAKFTFPVGS